MRQPQQTDTGHETKRARTESSQESKGLSRLLSAIVALSYAMGQGRRGVATMGVESKLVRIEGSLFPDKISALVHVLESIDELLMRPEEVAIKFAATNQLLWIDRLLESLDGDLADAISKREKQTANERDDSEESNCDSDESSDDNEEFSDIDDSEDDRDGHSEDEEMIAGSSADEVALRKMYRATWQVLNEAATNGHLDVVNFAMDYATEWGYVELYAASGTCDALTRAIEGYHDDVATYLLGVCRIQWDLKSNEKQCFANNPFTNLDFPQLTAI
ncbi:hypothetical protein PC119_g23583 [Phytophthora cactorum]|nr:hypothetical protein PC119_g23583 [Phytophthora cactorum]